MPVHVRTAEAKQAQRAPIAHGIVDRAPHRTRTITELQTNARLVAIFLDSCRSQNGQRRRLAVARRARSVRSFEIHGEVFEGKSAVSALIRRFPVGLRLALAQRGVSRKNAESPLERQRPRTEPLC
jgi:hypothetical protein